ncbi:MAG: MarR family transcriptional regulator [Candidatus Bathyarchaeia archaeon]
MKASKLELYIAILESLAHRGPLTLAEIGTETDLKKPKRESISVELLLKRGLIRVTTTEGKQAVYAITARGLNVLKYFGRMNESLPFKGKPEENGNPCKDARTKF